MHFLSSLIYSSSATQTLKHLGYPRNTKLLIVHADDMGLSHSTNLACMKAMDEGLVNSGSIMMPCPFAEEMISFSKLNPTKDIGIHITLTSEWRGHQWKPILGMQVSSLVNSEGFFFESGGELLEKAILSEVEKEMCAQIEFALSCGMQPTHLDSHMFSGISNPEFLKIYIRVGRKYSLPVLLNREKIKKWFRYNLDPYLSDQEIPVSQLFIATPRQVRKGFPWFYRNVLQSIKPGLNCLLVHPAFDDDEMKILTHGYTDYNSSWRQADFDFFTSNECGQIIQERNIQLITWREIMEISKSKT